MACKLKTPRVKRESSTLKKAEERVRKHYEELSNAAGLIGKKNAGFLRMRQNLDLALTGLMRQSLFTPATSEDWLHSFMSAKLGWRKKIFSDELSKAGAINEQLLRSGNAAVNVFKEYVSNQALPATRRHLTELKEMLPGVSRREVYNLLHDSAIVASTDEIADSVGKGGRQFLEKRLLAFHEKLQSMGLSQTQITRVLEIGTEYADIYKAGQAFLLDNGFDISRLPGYVPLGFDTDFLDKIKKASGGKLTFSDFLESVGKSGAPDSTKMRGKFINYVIDDLELFRERAGKLMNKLGLPTDDESLLSYAFGNAAKFKEEFLDKLSDNTLSAMLSDGLLARIPALHDEIADMLLDELPNGLDPELIFESPIKALKSWASSLDQTLQESFVFKDVMTKGIAEGWVVGADVAKQFPDQFIQLKGLPWLKSYNQNLANAVGEQYVHKIVAQQLTALYDLNVNPGSLGMLGKALDNFKRYTGYLSKSVLGNPVTAIAQVSQSILSSVIAGANPIHLPGAVSDAFQIIFGNLDVFDNTKAVFQFGDELLTKQQMIKKLLFTRGNVEFKNFKDMFDWEVGRAAQKWAMGVKVSPLRSIEDALGGVADLFFVQTAFANVLGETIGRLALLRSIADNNNLGGFILRPKINNFEDALRFTDEYMSFFDGRSEVGSLLGRYVRPFASFLMNAPGQSVRHAMRYPHRFKAAMDFYYTHSIRERDNIQYTEYSWNRERLTVPLFVLPNGVRVEIAPSTLDNNLATIEMVDNIVNTGARILGFKTRDRIADLEAKANPQKTAMSLVEGLLAGNYGDTIRNAVLGRNTFSGGEMTTTDSVTNATWLGIPVSKQLRAILQVALPFTNQLDRMLPGEIVGKRDVRNAVGNVVEPAIPSWTGAVPESGGAQGEFWVNSGLGLVGLRPVYTDQILAIVRNSGDVERIQGDTKAAIRYLEQRGRTNTPEYQRLTEVLKESEALLVEINATAIQKKVPPPAAIKMLRQRLRTIETQRQQLQQQQ